MLCLSHRQPVAFETCKPLPYVSDSLPQAPFLPCASCHFMVCSCIIHASPCSNSQYYFSPICFFFQPSITHTHSLTHSLTHTHNHTHTRYIHAHMLFVLSILYLMIGTHAHTRARAHTHTLSLSLTHVAEASQSKGRRLSAKKGATRWKSGGHINMHSGMWRRLHSRRQRAGERAGFITLPKLLQQALSVDK